jgi:alpha-galactosidase/6-phospho-beta-glucosidase family protein
MNTTETLPETEIVHEQHSEATEIKIAYIGGGSRQWAVGLMSDLALTPRLSGTLALYDIDFEAAAYNQRLSEEIFSHPQSQTKFTVRPERSLAETLRGADFVVISIEPGPTALRYADLEIPASYGILQTVGDTTGPGGIVRALRSIPIFRGLAREIMEHCPKAWVINYTNPMTLCTAALFAEAPGIKAFGCCHEVFNTQKLLAELVEKWFGADAPPREEIELDIAGVNHFTWATKAVWKGRDLMPGLQGMIREEGFFRSRGAVAEKRRANQEWFSSDSLVAFDLLRRFGALGAAGDRHLVEFMPGYLGSEAELHRWGVVRTPFWWREERSRQPARALGSYTGKPLTPTGEEGVLQMEALLGLRPLTTNVNVPNAGQIPALPHGHVVETYAEFRQNAIRPLLAAPLPAGAAALTRRTVDAQSLTLQASLESNLDLAFQAILLDPLVNLPVDDAWKMFREMVAYVRDAFPGQGLEKLMPR